MQKRWNILPFDEDKALSLKSSLNISLTICKILVQRGIESFESAKNYFRPQASALHDPWLMKDMDKAVNRIEQAFTSKEKILVFGDYDVDGTTSVATMYQFICSIYDPALVDFYIPHRYREGYGVSKMGIDHAAATGCTLIICLDCGIKSSLFVIITFPIKYYPLLLRSSIQNKLIVNIHTKNFVAAVLDSN